MYIAQQLDYEAIRKTLKAYMTKTSETFDLGLAQEQGLYHVLFETCANKHHKLDLRMQKFIDIKRMLGSEIIHPYHDYSFNDDARIYLWLNDVSMTCKLIVLDVTYYAECDEIFEDYGATEDCTNCEYGRVIVTCNTKFIREFVEYVLR